MNFFNKKAIIILSFFLFVACVGNSQDEFSFHDNGVIAHRGAWKNTKETQNSLGSLRKAIELGCQGSEFDIQLTADDSLVVYHNLNHHKMIIDSTNYQQLISIKLDNGEKIPTMREYLQEGMKQKKTKLIVDIKTPKNVLRTIKIAQKALALVQEMGAETWVEFLGSDIPALTYLQKNTDCPVAYLGRWKTEIKAMNPDSALQNGFRYIDYQAIHYRNNPEWVTRFRNENIHLNAWVVDLDDDMEWFINQKFDYITTDEPENLLTNLLSQKTK